MKSSKRKAGEVLFRKGDEAEHLYILVEGRVDFPEVNVSAKPGEIFGEIAFFSPERRRTLSARLRRGLRPPQHRPEHRAPALLPEPGLRVRDRRLDRRPALRRHRAPARPAGRATRWRRRRAAGGRDGGQASSSSSSRSSSLSSASDSIESSLPVIDSAESSASFERAMRSGAMSAPSRAPSGTASARSPVPSASLSLSATTGSRAARCLAFLGLGLHSRRALDVAAAVGAVARTERVGVAAGGLLGRAIAAEDAAVGHEFAPIG